MKICSFFLVTVCLASSALAAPVSFSTTLSGANENPATGSPATGSAFVTIDLALNTLFVQVSFSGLTANATAAHIHCCVAAPGNVGVATQTPTFAGFPAATSGAYSNTFDTSLAATFNAAYITANGGTPASAAAALAAGLANGQAYLNIHDSNVPGGEIRGFLTQTPEPSTAVLSGIALAALAFYHRKR